MACLEEGSGWARAPVLEHVKAHVGQLVVHVLARAVTAGLCRTVHHVSLALLSCNRRQIVDINFMHITDNKRNHRNRI